MTFSIIIPLYNKESGIRKTISSILHQSIDDYEIIIVDDGSTDKSRIIVEEIKDPRIIIIQQENAGPSAARNRGVKEAVGDWILYLDADDYLEHNALEKFALQIKKYPSVRVITCNFYIENNGIRQIRSQIYNSGVISNNFRAWFFNRLFSCQGAYILNREVALKHPFPLHLRRWEDACMFFDIMREEKILRCSEPVFTYRRDLSKASMKLQNPMQDFVCNLCPQGKGFWERLCMYDFFIHCKSLYPDEAKNLYGKRFDVWYIGLSYRLIKFIIDTMISVKHFF